MLEGGRGVRQAHRQYGPLEVAVTRSKRGFRAILLRERDLVEAGAQVDLAEVARALQPEVRDFDPRLALDGGADGLDFYRRLAAEGLVRLRRDGRLMLEFGDGQETALGGLFAGTGWAVEAVVPDDTGRPRILIAHHAE